MDEKQMTKKAHLFAAAPELLAACKWAEAYLGNWSSVGPDGHELRDKILAIIAKAEGRES